MSCEGSVTEEEYIEILSQIYDGVKGRVQLISVAEDEIHTRPKKRTKEQNQLLRKSKPWQLVDRIDKFKREKESTYEFSKYPDDEFWIVADVDDNLDNHRSEFEKAISDCEQSGYRYAISNPFFEIWLLLHHDNVCEEDKKYAVTETHPYEATDYFRDCLPDGIHCVYVLTVQQNTSMERYHSMILKKRLGTLKWTRTIEISMNLPSRCREKREY